jgi:protein SCO1/2
MPAKAGIHDFLNPMRLLLLALLLLFTSCRHDLSQQDVNVRGMVPALALEMTDVTTNQPVTAANFRGKVTLLYFGYTNCPDVCPATLYNVDKILRRLGPLASQVQLLFVTVDPNRDTPAALAQYVALFGPNIIGLRGTDNQLFSLARRYRVVFSVKPSPNPQQYQVSHSAAIYVFDASGQAQYLIAGLDTDAPDLPGITADLKDTIQQNPKISVLSWLQSLISSG